MKKTLTMALALIILTSGLLSAQSSEANEAYIKAMTAQAPAQKAQMLKDYLARYGGKGSQYENFANANLAILAYPGKTASDTISYGEKALQLGGLDDLSKYQVMIAVAGTCVQYGQNLEKAKSLAVQAVELCKSSRGKEGENSSQWNQLMGAAHYVHGQAAEKTKDYRTAAESFANSYTILKNPQIMASLKKLGKTLYDAKAYAEAEKVFKLVAASTKDPDIALLYAGALYKSGKIDEALSAYQEIYAKNKNGDVAFNIGIILTKRAQTQPSLASEAISYLLDASFLSPANSKQAMSMAESLFFTSNKEFRWNDTVNQINALSKKIEDMTKTFNDKFGDKDEEEMKDSQKAEMKNLLTGIDTEKKNLEKLKANQNVVMAKFTTQIEDTKRRLGIR
jgi:tetratricopeptide (TPR) repeat protein